MKGNEAGGGKKEIERRGNKIKNEEGRDIQMHFPGFPGIE